MKIRKLLISSPAKNDIEAGLKRMYLKRIKEMFKKSITMETTFNIFDEVFHGIAQTSSISENLHSFYEAFLTITQYYQHSQAGRGSLVAKLLEDLGTSERIEYEFSLVKLPDFLGNKTTLKENELTKQKFDIITRNDDNLAFCELKMKVYSGCSAGRIELMEKFNKFVKLIIGDQAFREILKSAEIKHVYLIGGVLFDIEGNPASTQKDEEWGICYNGLIRARKDIIRTFENNNVEYNIDETKLPEKAFIIKFDIDDIEINIVAVYGNEVINYLFSGKQIHDIGYFKQQLEGMLYDDLWLGQIVTLSERAILDQNFKKNKKIENFVTYIITNNSILNEIVKLSKNRTETVLKDVVRNTIEIIKKSNPELLNVGLIPAELIIKSTGEEYSIEDYISDIVQFLSCEEILRNLIAK